MQPKQSIDDVTFPVGNDEPPADDEPVADGGPAADGEPAPNTDVETQTEGGSIRGPFDPIDASDESAPDPD